MEMTDLQIKTVSEILEKISKFKTENNLTENNRLVYRGIASTSYALICSLGRDKKFIKNEKELFYEFSRCYYRYTDLRPTNPVDILALAQHYGLPTRLMDWTTNPLIALYFACQDTKGKEKDGRVYIKKLPPSGSLRKGIQKGVQLEGFIALKKEFKKIFQGGMQEGNFIWPENEDVRFQHQSGLFFCCKNPKKAISSDGTLYIKSEDKESLLRDLAILGISKSFVLPLLDNLCEDLKQSVAYPHGRRSM